MDYLALWAEIQARPECTPHIVPSQPKAEDAVAAAGDQAIADIINVGRVRIASREVGEGTVSNALGVPDGPIFILRLRSMALAALPEGATPEQIMQKALVEQAWRLLDKACLDVGLPSVRGSIGLFVPALLTQDQAAAILALAEIPDPVTASDVSRAVRGPRE